VPLAFPVSKQDKETGVRHSHFDMKPSGNLLQYCGVEAMAILFAGFMYPLTVGLTTKKIILLTFRSPKVDITEVLSRRPQLAEARFIGAEGSTSQD